MRNIPYAQYINSVLKTFRNQMRFTSSIKVVQFLKYSRVPHLMPPLSGLSYFEDNLFNYIPTCHGFGASIMMMMMGLELFGINSRPGSTL